jgi:hypothetical protein
MNATAFRRDRGELVHRSRSIIMLRHEHSVACRATTGNERLAVMTFRRVNAATREHDGPFELRELSPSAWAKVRKKAVFSPYLLKFGPAQTLLHTLFEDIAMPRAASDTWRKVGP